MILFQRFKIRTYEMGLLFRDGDFRGVTFVPKALVAERVELKAKGAPRARKAKEPLP